MASSATFGTGAQKTEHPCQTLTQCRAIVHFSLHILISYSIPASQKVSVWKNTIVIQQEWWKHLLFHVVQLVYKCTSTVEQWGARATKLTPWTRLTPCLHARFPYKADVMLSEPAGGLFILFLCVCVFLYPVTLITPKWRILPRTHTHIHAWISHFHSILI